MKRQAVTLQELAHRDNLLLATWKAARGKRDRPAVMRWLADLDEHLNGLSDRILRAQVPTGDTRRFVIHDPKRRLISASCFPDRVLHHAILNRTEVRFEQALAPSAYACRPGRGVHAAIVAVQRGLQQNPWVVQIDIDGYFPSIRHDLLLAQLARRFKGADFMALLQRLVEQGAVTAGRGLPIGALTSQHFANAYLGSADRLLEQLPHVASPVRYMDDMVWFCPSKAQAQHSLGKLRQHLADDLGLRVKPAVVLRPTEDGIRFCGCRVRRGTVWPGLRRVRRYRQAVARLQAAEREGVPQCTLQRAHDSAAAALLPAETMRLRQRLWGATFEPAVP